MTLPFERTNAVLNTRRFLVSLLDRKKTPRVPREIRKQAYYLLKHFPNEHDLYQLVKKDASVFGKIEKDERFL